MLPNQNRKTNKYATYTHSNFEKRIKAQKNESGYQIAIENGFQSNMGKRIFVFTIWKYRLNSR